MHFRKLLLYLRKLTLHLPSGLHGGRARQGDLPAVHHSQGPRDEAPRVQGRAGQWGERPPVRGDAHPQHRLGGHPGAAAHGQVVPGGAAAVKQGQGAGDLRTLSFCFPGVRTRDERGWMLCMVDVW